MVAGPFAPRSLAFICAQAAEMVRVGFVPLQRNVRSRPYIRKPLQTSIDNSLPIASKTPLASKRPQMPPQMSARRLPDMKRYTVWGRALG